MIYMGQLDCYGNAQASLNKFLGIELNAMQIHRLTNKYGQAAGQLEMEKQEKPQAAERVYAQLDGSMILTRLNGWKEVKVGRIFRERDYIKGEEIGQGWIKRSDYEAVIGDKEEFTDVFERRLETYGPLSDHLIFITDGAIWIRNWMEDTYPEAVQILDFYHAAEYLHGFAQEYFADPKARKKWTGKQKQWLLNSKLSQVLENIESLEPHPTSNEQRERLLNYYRTNQSRMDYKRYRKLGAGLIGSGAIEATHRSLVQKRLKHSGQRWTVPGAQNILNLRSLHMSGRWPKVINLIEDNNLAIAA
jgi:hypothetical protein